VLKLTDKVCRKNFWKQRSLSSFRRRQANSTGSSLHEKIVADQLYRSKQRKRLKPHVDVEKKNDSEKEK